MTQNADVEWLRNNSHDGIEWVVMERSVARRILAHIDQLEAEVRRLTTLVQLRPLTEPEPSRAPSVDEIAVQMMAALLSQTDYDDKVLAPHRAYELAEALVAERERRQSR